MKQQKRTASTGREKPSGQCPLYKKCGGCQLQNLDYVQQLQWKQRLEERLLGKFASVQPIIGMQKPYHYRNKVQAAFGTNRRREVISGVYQSSTHRIVPVESCQLEDQTADAIIATVRRLCPDFKILPYDEDRGTGLLRHVLVKRGFHSGEVMVVLVTSGPILPARNNFVAALRRQHPEITTILQNINPYRTSLVLGEQEKVLYGSGTIEDTLCGCRFRISARSFYQVNPIQTEVLYSKAVEFAQLTGNETAIDAYCGIGTIGLIASYHARNVIGVELNREAIRDAIFNGRLNKIENARFYCADAGEWMLAMAKEQQKADVVFMDPPRAGSDECFLHSLLTLAPQRIVYISCNPETLARDLKILTESSYTVEKIQPVDMFPHTHHVETVVLLSRETNPLTVEVRMEVETGEVKEHPTYKRIQEYVQEKYGFKVHTAYIAEVKRMVGLDMHKAPNAVEQRKHEYHPCPPEKVEAIKDALRHFGLISE